jgi:hypothetical protein
MLKITTVLYAPKSIYVSSALTKVEQTNSNQTLTTNLTTVTNLNTTSATELEQPSLYSEYQFRAGRFYLNELNRSSFNDVHRISGILGVATTLQNSFHSSSNSSTVRLINSIDSVDDITESVNTQQQARLEATAELNEQRQETTEIVTGQELQTQQTNQSLESVATSITNLLAPYRTILIIGGISVSSYLLFRSTSLDHLAAITREHLSSRQPAIQPNSVSTVSNVNVNIFSNISISRTVPTVAATIIGSAISTLTKYFTEDDRTSK